MRSSFGSRTSNNGGGIDKAGQRLCARRGLLFFLGDRTDGAVKKIEPSQRGRAGQETSPTQSDIAEEEMNRRNCRDSVEAVEGRYGRR